MVGPGGLAGRGRGRADGAGRGCSGISIGRYFGGRNHATALSAEKRVIGWLHDEHGRSLLPGFETIADLERSLLT